MTEPWNLTEAQRRQFREAQAAAKASRPGGRTLRQRHPRHPAEVTADRLGDALDKWPDKFDGADCDMVAQIRHILNTIAEEARGDE